MRPETAPDDSPRRRFARLKDLFHELSALESDERRRRLAAVREESESLHGELVDLLAEEPAAEAGLEQLASLAARAAGREGPSPAREEPPGAEPAGVGSGRGAVDSGRPLRFRLASASAAAAALLLLGALAVSTALWLEARRAEERATRARLEAESALRASEETTQFMLGLFEAADPAEDLGLDLTARDLLERGIARADELKDEPQVHALLLETLGTVSWSLGALDRAQGLFEDALATRARGAPDAAREANSRVRLGTIARDREDLEGAEDHYRSAIAALELAGQDPGPELAGALNSLGIVLSRQGRFEEASTALERSLAISEGGLGDLAAEPLGIAAAQANLAILYHRLGKFEASLETQTRALALFEQHLPAGHPNLAVLQANLALTARSLGRLGVARERALSALEIDRRVLPASHPGLAADLHGLGAVERRLGRLEAARSAFAEGLAILEEAHGEAHFSSTAHRNDLALVALDAGQVREALRVLEPLAEELEASGDARAPGRLVAALRLLALAQLRLGLVAEAEGSARLAAERVEEIPLPAERGPIRFLEAWIALAAGQEDRARALYAEALEFSECRSSSPCADLDDPRKILVRARWHAARSEADATFRTLDFALDHAGWGAALGSAAVFDSVRRDPRWRGFAARREAKVAAALGTLSSQGSSTGAGNRRE
ncbi:MAG: tetratricopeptide repeat protein [Acidobacteriota bacterium]